MDLAKLMRRSKVMAMLLLTVSFQPVIASEMPSYISTQKQSGYFAIAEAGRAAPLYASSEDFKGVHRVLKHFQEDIERVTDQKPTMSTEGEPEGKEIILVGTLGKNAAIDKMVAEKKIDVSDIEGKWETFLIQVVENPMANVDRALVVVGSDKRGTIYGMFDISEKMGVSPWYWWADVPPKKKTEVYVRPGRYTLGEPKVKYRGIFINDEAPALTNWVFENFDGFNSKFYVHVFELILRLKGNYLWPAMWGRAIYDDDPVSPTLANEYGVVIGTSHHEPLMRAHVEWSRYGKGDWNYETNPEELRKFWREGIERMDNNESVVTIGMRGDGDEAMTEGTAIELLERIVKDQRQIIADVTGKPPEETPQVWALYKEVQDYYDKGMRVPDDVMLLLCDDNWGNVRVLPKKEDLGRKGGFGIYYHFDFVGGPVSYRWLNVTQIEKVWEQFNLSYEWGARELWLVNVGDIKPMEFPISFFLDFAWDPESFRASNLPQYYVSWAEEQFGSEHAEEIAEILSLYTKYNARRTPEMLKPDTYSLFDYREADTIVADYNALVENAKNIYDKLPETYKSAFYQLVLFPVEICANLNEMYVSAGKNQIYAGQDRASANVYAAKVQHSFEKDSLLTKYFHEELAGGKWNHFMSQTHIGYTSWNNPPKNIMPKVMRVEPGENAGLGIAVEGSATAGAGSLPHFDPINDQSYYIEIFNTGLKELEYSVKAKDKWIRLSAKKGTTKLDDKVFVSIDWKKAPKAQEAGKIVISGAGARFEVNVPIRNDLPSAAGFVENNGVVSIEAADFTNSVNSDKIHWTVVPNMGRTDSAVMPEPANADRQKPGNGTPRLEYSFTVFDAGKLTIEAYLAPTLNYQKNEGLKYAISIDDETPQTINIHEGETQPDWKYPAWWNNSVTDHVRKKKSVHTVAKAGKHTLKVWMVDPGVVFQKFVIDVGGLKPSYLGPPESLVISASSAKK